MLQVLHSRIAQFNSCIVSLSNFIQVLLILKVLSTSVRINPWQFVGERCKTEKVGEKACVSAPAKNRCDERWSIAVVQEDIYHVTVACC